MGLSSMIDAKDFPEALKKAKKEILKTRKSPRTFEEAVKVVTKAIEIIVIAKNKKYGKKNIMDLGDFGIFCRTYDKTSRLREHFVEGSDLGSETEIDSFGDLAGYSTVFLLWKKGWFELK